MNNRDPFSLRRNTPAFSLLHTSAASLGKKAVQVSQQAAAAGAQVVETSKILVEGTLAGSEDKKSNMSAYAPAQTGSTQRHYDSWQSSGQSRFDTNGHADGGVREKINDMFSGDRRSSLPMYKDKPYQYPGSRRKVPWFRQKRVIALILTSLAGLSWWFGILSPLSYATSSGQAAPKKSKSAWSLFGSGSGVVDWDERAERVKDAFKVSFSDYEKHAWGMCRVWLPHLHIMAAAD